MTGKRLLLLLFACLLSLTVAACDSEKKSSGGGGEGGGAAAGGGGGGGGVRSGGIEGVGHVEAPPERTPREKAQIRVNRLESYIIGAKSKVGTPADPAAAAEAVRDTYPDWPIDPWGQPYVYIKSEKAKHGFVVFSSGPDKNAETKEDNVYSTNK